MEGVAEVPYRSEDQFGVGALFFRHIAASMKRFRIVHHLLYDIETHQCIHIDVVLPGGRILVRCIDGVVGGFQEVGDVCLLCGREYLWRVIGEPQVASIAFFEADLSVFFVVVDFEQPSARNLFRIGFLVGLFHYIHAVGFNTYLVGQHIQSNIVAVEHHLYGLLFRRVCQTDQSAQLEAHRVAQESQIVVGMSKQVEVFVFLHTQRRSLLLELQAIGLFAEAVPCIVAMPFDFQCQRRFL